MEENDTGLYALGTKMELIADVGSERSTRTAITLHVATATILPIQAGTKVGVLVVLSPSQMLKKQKLMSKDSIIEVNQRASFAVT